MRGSTFAYFCAGALVAMIYTASTASLDARPGLRKGSHVNLSPADYFEIQQLISEYPRDVDPGSVRNAAWMFTPDARSVIAGPPMVKPADFENFYGSLVHPSLGQASKGGNRHFNMSSVIIGLPDGTARGSSMMMGVSIKGPGEKPTIDLIGKYEDLYVKTPKGWMMKERIWTGDQHVGSYQPIAPSPVISNQKTWTTNTNDVIARMEAAGQTRDATGAPVVAPGQPRPNGIYPDTPKH